MRLSRALVCEFLGTAFLLASVVGSGILADRLDMGNVALSVLCVALAAGATLSACIFALGHISAHFNPVVTLALACRGEFPWKNVLPYTFVQIAAAIAAAVICNLMFELPPVSISETVRSGAGQWLGEVVATFGLLGIIFGTSGAKPSALPLSVPFYVAGAVLFTSSTCFANPAVTIGRIFTNTLTGIAPASVLPFIGFELAGAAAALLVFGWLFQAPENISTYRRSGAVQENRELVAPGR
jgi:glycerol uptake facilitator-like aquaporin